MANTSQDEEPQLNLHWDKCLHLVPNDVSSMIAFCG